MPLLTQHLLETFPELKKKHPNLSRQVIEHLFLPPNETHSSAKEYYCIIKSRPYIPNNNNFKKDEKYHVGHSQVKLLLELFSRYHDETLIISYDNKNKIGIGRPAVSRLNRAKKWFMKEDAPVFDIHDFAVDFHIIPSAYLILTQPENFYVSNELDHLGNLLLLLLILLLLLLLLLLL
jgi:hypothetical protein